jgi:hypothetical protein
MRAMAPLRPAACQPLLEFGKAPPLGAPQKRLRRLIGYREGVKPRLERISSTALESNSILLATLRA